MSRIKEGDLCKLRKDKYLILKVKRILPKGSHDRKCELVECWAEPDRGQDNMSFALMKTFRMVDLVAIERK